MEMQRAREQFLAGAGLALDQDRQLGAGRFARQVTKLGHRLAGVDEALEGRGFDARSVLVPVVKKRRVLADFEFAREQPVAAREFARFERALDDEADLIGAQRLGEILVGRGARQRVGQRNAAIVADQQNAHEIGMGEAKPRQEADDVAVVAIDVGDDEVDMRVAHDVRSLRLPRRHDDAVIRARGERFRGGALLRVRIGEEEDCRFHGHPQTSFHTGKTVTTAPGLSN